MVFNKSLRSKDKVAMFFAKQQRILVFMYLNRASGTRKLYYSHTTRKISNKIQLV